MFQCLERETLPPVQGYHISCGVPAAYAVIPCLPQYLKTEFDAENVSNPAFATAQVARASCGRRQIVADIFEKCTTSFGVPN